MMLCKADFEQLFPKSFAAEHRPVQSSYAQAATSVPSAKCIARWEDDGGTAIPATRPVNHQYAKQNILSFSK